MKDASYNYPFPSNSNEKLFKSKIGFKISHLSFSSTSNSPPCLLQASNPLSSKAQLFD
jgi:hypothetical protein